MDNSKQLTQDELADALLLLAKRLTNIGWMDRTAASQDRMHFGYTKDGLAKMETLRSLLFDAVDPDLSYAEFRALSGLLLTLDHRLPELPEPPQQ